MFDCPAFDSRMRQFTSPVLALGLIFGTLGAPSLLAQPKHAPQHASVAENTGDHKAEQFVDNLLHKMTLQEKIGQMSQIALNQPQDVPPEQRAAKGEIGSFLFITDPNEINRLQHAAVDKSRMHIPIIFGFDVVHGFRTIYPIPLALASSWDPAMVEHVQSMAAREAAASGINWTFAPMLDIARDPRWGRIMEGAGEDPYLGSRMAEAQVRGFQGAAIGSPNHILACIKHYAGYGAAVGGRDYDSSDISEEQLWNVYLPPFEAAIRAGAGSVMPAYMDLNGVPAAANKFLLQDVLRDKWKFKGFVVSDWDAVRSLTTHGFASGPEDAAARAVNAGLDMEMTGHVYRDELANAVRDGKVKPATIDESVRRILLMKYKLGLFQHPYVDASKTAAETVNAEQRREAKLAAERSAVLLRNEDNVLPLSKSVSSIAVIGPLADSKPDTMGSWSLAGRVDATVTVLEGIRKRFGSTASIVSTKGVEITRGGPSIFDSQFSSPQPVLKTDAEREAEFNHAIDLIKKSEIAVLVLGEAQNMSGERASRATLTLPGEQEKLLEAAVAIGKPVVLVLLNGRPLNITWASQHVPAILEAWYPGTEGGDAIAALLAGDANPGGKLPVTWPRSVGQVPFYYDHNLTQIPNDVTGRYWDESSAPLYPFGYGLSYAAFKVDGLKLSASSVKAGTAITVSVNVHNTGKVAGDEVVQLYTHQRAGSASRPVRELKAFRRVTLGPGETRTITLKLNTSELAFWSTQTRRRAIEPGVFDLWAGTDSDAVNHATFTVVQ